MNEHKELIFSEDLEYYTKKKWRKSYCEIYTIKRLKELIMVTIKDVETNDDKEFQLFGIDVLGNGEEVAFYGQKKVHIVNFRNGITTYVELKELLNSHISHDSYFLIFKESSVHNHEFKPHIPYRFNLQEHRIIVSTGSKERRKLHVVKNWPMNKLCDIRLLKDNRSIDFDILEDKKKVTYSFYRDKENDAKEIFKSFKKFNLNHPHLLTKSSPDRRFSRQFSCNDAEISPSRKEYLENSQPRNRTYSESTNSSNIFNNDDESIQSNQTFSNESSTISEYSTKTIENIDNLNYNLEKQHICNSEISNCTEISNEPHFDMDMSVINQSNEKLISSSSQSIDNNKNYPKTVVLERIPFQNSDSGVNTCEDNVGSPENSIIQSAMSYSNPSSTNSPNQSPSTHGESILSKNNSRNCYASIDIVRHHRKTYSETLHETKNHLKIPIPNSNKYQESHQQTSLSESEIMNHNYYNVRGTNIYDEYTNEEDKEIVYADLQFDDDSNNSNNNIQITKPKISNNYIEISVDHTEAMKKLDDNLEKRRTDNNIHNHRSTFLNKMKLLFKPVKYSD